MNCFRCLLIKSYLFVGQVPCFNVSLFSVSLGCCSIIYIYIYIYIYMYEAGLIILTVVVVTLNCKSCPPQTRYVLGTGLTKLDCNLSVMYMKVCN